MATQVFTYISFTLSKLFNNPRRNSKYMNIRTKAESPYKVFTANSTSASITNPAPTTTAPSGTGVVDLRTLGLDQTVPNFGEFVFFGAGSNNAAGTATVYLWYLVGTLWYAVPVLHLDVTLGQAVGVAGADLVATDRLADTLALTSATVNDSSAVLLSPADDSIAVARLDISGASRIEVRVAKGTATNLNALFRGF